MASFNRCYRFSPKIGDFISYPKRYKWKQNWDCIFFRLSVMILSQISILKSMPKHRYVWENSYKTNEQLWARILFIFYIVLPPQFSAIWKPDEPFFFWTYFPLCILSLWGKWLEPDNDFLICSYLRQFVSMLWIFQENVDIFCLFDTMK